MKSTEKLLAALRAAHAPKWLIERAERDEFHDFKSPSATPCIDLVQALAQAVQLDLANGPLEGVRQAAMDGAFDATKEESDEWAASPDGQRCIDELLGRAPPMNVSSARVPPGPWARLGCQTGCGEPIKTRHGTFIDSSMIGTPLPVPGERWERWASVPRKSPAFLVEVWLSRQYLVQVFDGPEPWRRIGIRRIDGQDIRENWSELQAIKDEVLGPEVTAVEVYPAASNLVNVAPMRWLWVVPDAKAFPFWTKDNIT